jgi:hypothetical protein
VVELKKYQNAKENERAKRTLALRRREVGRTGDPPHEKREESANTDIAETENHLLDEIIKGNSGEIRTGVPYEVLAAPDGQPVGCL